MAQAKSLFCLLTPSLLEVPRLTPLLTTVPVPTALAMMAQVPAFRVMEALAHQFQATTIQMPTALAMKDQAPPSQMMMAQIQVSLPLRPSSALMAGQLSSLTALAVLVLAKNSLQDSLHLSPDLCPTHLPLLAARSPTRLLMTVPMARLSMAAVALALSLVQPSPRLGRMACPPPLATPGPCLVVFLRLKAQALYLGLEPPKPHQLTSLVRLLPMLYPLGSLPMWMRTRRSPHVSPTLSLGQTASPRPLTQLLLQAL